MRRPPIRFPRLPVATALVALIAAGHAPAGFAQATCTLTGGSSPTPIASIQGSGAVTPLNGTTVTTSGVVTAVFPNLRGFYLQDPVGDGDPTTSEGLFVFVNTTSIPAAIAPGQQVCVRGTAGEFNTATQVTATTANVQALGPVTPIVPIDVALPEAFEGELERFEGMLIRIPATLTVGQNFFQGRFGQLYASAEGRLEKPTNRARPGPDAAALALDNARRRILIDDGSSNQNPSPVPYLLTEDALRAGDTVTGLTGILDVRPATADASATGLRDYAIHPTVAPSFVRANPRPSVPPTIPGNVRVTAFNVLNFFTSIDGQVGCFPGFVVGTSASDCRGADSATELERQRAKIVAALSKLTAAGVDVIGLIEIENNGATGAQALVDAVNAVVGAGTWARVPEAGETPAAPALPGAGGGDAIQVTMIYRPARLSLVGASLRDRDPVHNRPPLAQTFAAANGERFSVVVNHFKSKSCTGATGADLDQGDLQGCFNPTRVAQAERLLAFIDTVRAAANDNDVLVVGDLNAYAFEDPVHAFTSRGWVDELQRFVRPTGAIPYTYVFDGEAGALDHVLSSPSLAPQVRGAAAWLINADESSVLDYNLEFKPTAVQALYRSHEFRSSDHDPVIVGLELLRRIDGTANRDVLTGTPGDDVITGGPGADMIITGAGRDRVVFTSMRDAIDTILDFTPGQDVLDLSALLASLGVPIAGDPVAAGQVRLVASFMAGGPATIVQIDADGTAGPGLPRSLAVLRAVDASTLNPARDLVLR